LGIAAALSGDRRMKEAYASGDPYMWFGRFAKLVPPDATKKTHGTDRDRFKTVMLGVLYGLSETGLARKLNLTPAHGRELMQLHKETFRTFWGWSDTVQDEAVLTGELRTVFGWPVHVGPDTKPTSLRNFPMQGNGAEMMRLAACLATERGVGVCCPIHDAFLIEAEADDLEVEAERMQAAMREASELVLPGFPLRTDVKFVRYPDRYADDRGRLMWETVNNILDTIDPRQPDSECDGYADQGETGSCLTSLHPFPYSSSSYSDIPLWPPTRSTRRTSGTR
jgi:DNA polymerase I-like protein with 3'-5' exonuclease and polymerase domains